MVSKSPENYAFVIQRLVAADAKGLPVYDLIRRGPLVSLALEQGRPREEETGREQEEYLGSECHGTDI